MNKRILILPLLLMVGCKARTFGERDAKNLLSVISYENHADMGFFYYYTGKQDYFCIKLINSHPRGDTVRTRVYVLGPGGPSTVENFELTPNNHLMIRGEAELPPTKGTFVIAGGS